MNENDPEFQRFIESVAIGHFADAVFDEACALRGVSPVDCIASGSPLFALAMSEFERPGRLN